VSDKRRPGDGAPLLWSGFGPSKRKEGGTRFHPLCLPSQNSPGLVYYRAAPEGTHKLWQQQRSSTTACTALIRISSVDLGVSTDDTRLGRERAVLGSKRPIDRGEAGRCVGPT